MKGIAVFRDGREDWRPDRNRHGPRLPDGWFNVDREEPAIPLDRFV